ncbi:MAG: transcriptional regulator [Clostridiales bacterium]|jgi:DNA-binding MarR family transcriptional regulator|nr:transcriptional regulator [Clostridiales bacterium]
MNNTDLIDHRKDIFGKLMFLSNKLRTLGDKTLVSDDITIRQWLLLLAIAQYGDSPPTLGEIAEFIGSTHQNVKQLIIKLRENGFLDIIRDEKDNRAIRILLTEKSFMYRDKMDIRLKGFLTELFQDLSPEEICLLNDCLDKLKNSVPFK